MRPAPPGINDAVMTVYLHEGDLPDGLFEARLGEGSIAVDTEAMGLALVIHGREGAGVDACTH